MIRVNSARKLWSASQSFKHSLTAFFVHSTNEHRGDSAEKARTEKKDLIA